MAAVGRSFMLDASYFRHSFALMKSGSKGVLWMQYYHVLFSLNVSKNNYVDPMKAKWTQE